LRFKASKSDGSGIAKEHFMKTLSLLPMGALALAMALPLIPQAASAQEGGGISREDLREFLREGIESRREMRGSMMEGMRDRHDRRSHMMDMMDERRERRQEMMERLSPEQRERIRERLSGRLGDEGERGEGKGSEGKGSEGLRERIRERVRERMASRPDGDGEGRCFFSTRILRSEDGDVTAMVRRRICRD